PPAGVSTTACRSRAVFSATVALAHLRERGGVEVVGRRHCHLAGGHGPQGGGAQPALEDGSLAEDGAGAQHGHALAVDLDTQHAVEQEEELVARLPLLGERLALAELAQPRLLPTAHDRS